MPSVGVFNLNQPFNPKSMEKFLLLLLFPGFSFAQTTVPVGPGEYDCYFINSSGKLYHLNAALPEAMKVPSNLTWKYVAGGLHNGAAIDDLGHVWTLGDNSAGVAGNGSTAGTGVPSQVLKDSSGHVFDSVTQVTLWYSSGTGVLAVKSTGTLWIWGNLAGNMRGTGASSGTRTKPVRVMIPGNRKVVKVCANSVIEVLCSDGTVWTWGGTSDEILGTNNKDVTHPHQVILPQGAKDIACGGLWSYAVGADGALYGWGMYTNAMFGSYRGPYIITKPLDLKKYMGFPLPVSKVFVNTVCSYFILTDGSLWSCGDNVVGGLGNGKQYDQSKSETPYAIWPDPTAEEQLLQPVPTRIGPAGAKFVNVYVATADVFYFYAQDATGQLYSAGRNKGGVLGNGVRECDYVQGLLGSQRPNSWNVPMLTAVNPLALKTATAATSPFCQTGANQHSSPCNLCALLPPVSRPPEQAIPGMIQAEAYSGMSGIQTQPTSDAGGGRNVGWIDRGDWMDFTVKVATTGTYAVNFRIATPYTGVVFQLKSEKGTVLATVNPGITGVTGGFQVWQTVSAMVNLTAGSQILRVYSYGSRQWNLNWMQFQFINDAGAQLIPGTIQAESYSAMNGIAAQITADIGGLLNIGWIDPGDWMDYYVKVSTAGKYTVNFRVATPWKGSGFQLKSAGGAVLATMKLNPTGNYQKWTTVSATVTLPAGYQTLRLYSNLTQKWNIDWMRFTLAGSSVQADASEEEGKALSLSADPAAETSASFNIYPNPVSSAFTLQLDNAYTGNMSVQIIDVSGAVRQRYNFNKELSSILVNLSSGGLSSGTYFIRVQVGTWSETKKMSKL
jgi:hypothetical protein